MSWQASTSDAGHAPQGAPSPGGPRPAALPNGAAAAMGHPGAAVHVPSSAQAAAVPVQAAPAVPVQAASAVPVQAAPVVPAVAPAAAAFAPAVVPEPKVEPVVKPVVAPAKYLTKVCPPLAACARACVWGGPTEVGVRGNASGIAHVRVRERESERLWDGSPMRVMETCV